MSKFLSTLLSCALLLVCQSCKAQSKPAAQFNQSAMIFWTICNAVPMYQTEHDGKRPQSADQLLGYLDSLGAASPEIKKWIGSIKAGELIVHDPSTLQDDQPYISFRAKGEKTQYLMLKNQKVKTQTEP
jgi:hypothetical protein